MGGETPGKSLIDELPKGVKENLAAGENVACYLKTFDVGELPEYAIITDNRVIYFNEKHFGRYEFKSIPFQKLLQMKAHRGAVVWGEISFKSEDGFEVSLKRVNREEMVGFIETLKNAYNRIAVEPITIKHDKTLMGRENWEFNKPEEVVFRQQPLEQPKPADDPITQLKLRFVRGEISEEEYRAKLRVLQEK
ncbi:MAG: PH domain-containing protein [Candidatus Bathyarchaeia archaeon]